MSTEQPPPPWVEDAERLYLAKKLSSYRAVAAHFNVAHQTVGQWAKKRRWQDKLRKVEEAAARELDARIQAEAAEQIVDMFAAIEQNVVAAGLRASVIIQRHMDQAYKDQQAAFAKGAGYVPPGLHRSYFDAIERALDLRPRRIPGGGLLEELGQLLNPSDGEPEDEDLDDEGDLADEGADDAERLVDEHDDHDFGRDDIDDTGGGA